MSLRNLTLWILVSLALAACGGGGGGSGGANNGGSGGGNPPPPSRAISGIAILGPIGQASIELRGNGVVLASGTTASDGKFGPISYSGSYDGPLRIIVSATPEATWTCDFYPGCPGNDQIHAFGEAVPFSGQLEAVLPTSETGQFVSISTLSHIISARTSALGGLTATNINQANGEIASMISTVFRDVLNAQSFSITDDITSVRLFDITAPPAPSSDDDRQAALLSLLNSGMIGLAQPGETFQVFLSRIGNAIATNPELSVSDPDFVAPSMESLVLVALVQSVESINQGNPVLDAFNQLLAPFDLFDTADSLFDTWNLLPQISPGVSNVAFDADDAALLEPIFFEVPIGTSTGSLLRADEFGTAILGLPEDIWFGTTIVMRGDTPHVRIDVDNAKILALGNGGYEMDIEVFSTTGEYRRAFLPVRANVTLVGKQIGTGGDQAVFERNSIELSGSTTSPDEVTSINWVQTGGPTLQISNADTFQPTITTPSIDVESVAELRLDVTFDDGQARSETVWITIIPYPLISSLTFADSALQQCVDDAASSGNLTDAGELLSLSCIGVADASGLDVFAKLETLHLTDNSLTSLQSILSYDNLQFLDISGNPKLPCNEIDQLAETLVEGVDLIVDDTCQGGIVLDLAGQGFDIALDQGRNQLYVSVPDRNEILTISLDEFRIEDRLLMPGSANGIDISIDGTRLFVALNGSNAVGVMDIEQRSVTTIDLGVAVDDPATWDVVEGEPDRLFVSANPGSSGLSYVAQVRLDQGNIASPVANSNFIRARPALAKSPDQMFVYVGSGFSPNSLYKLSLADPDAPIVLEDDHGSVSGTDNLALNQTGTRIAMRTGQVLRTGSFIEEGRVSNGSSVGSNLTDTLFVASGNGQIEAYNFTTLALEDTTATNCDEATTSRIVAFDNDESFALLQGRSVCIHAMFSRSTPPDPYAALRMPDLALEECIIETAIDMGFTFPDEFSTLDCSLATKTILSLDGLQRFENLTSLDLSNSGVIDVSPLADLSQLQTLIIRSSRLSDLSPLFEPTALSTLDVTGNPAIPCSDLDELVADAVAVQADLCVSSTRIELGGIGHELVHDEAADRLFVSVPSLNRISEIDLSSGSISRNFSMAAQPRGIDLSSDGQTIYAALHGSGDIAVLDTTTGVSTNIDISAELNDDRTWDVAEVSAGRIVASANPGSNGLSYIVEILTDQGNAAQRVANDIIIRASPIFAVSPDETAVYVGAGFSPNSLYKLDTTQADLPVVLEDDHGEVTGTASLALSPDGERIYLRFGQVLSTDSFLTVAQFPPGHSTVSADGESLLIGDVDTDTARVYDIATTALVGSRQWGCNLLDLAEVIEYGDGVLVMGDDLVCYSKTVAYP